jgi:hypothetical protein
MSESRSRSTAKDDKAEEQAAEETGGLIFEEPSEETGASSMPVNTEWQDSAEREQEAAQEERVATAEAELEAAEEKLEQATANAEQAKATAKDAKDSKDK